MACVYVSMCYAYETSKGNGCSLFYDPNIVPCAFKTITRHSGNKIWIMWDLAKYDVIT